MSTPETFADVNVLNDDPGEGVLWTRVNVGEATPGTVSPLTAEFQRPANTWPAGRMFHRLGVLASPTIPGNQDTRTALTRFFFGKVAISVDFLRWIADRIPGTSGAEFEASILGRVREDVSSTPDHSRAPIVLAKVAWLIGALPAENARVYRETLAWWKAALARTRGADLAAAARLFDEARDRYETIIDHAGLLAFFSPAIMSQLAQPAGALGSAEDLLEIATGYGAIKEADMLEKLWAVARGRMRMALFLDEYGYMCAGGGELESKSWREDQTALAPLLATYRAQDRAEGPRARRERVSQRAHERQAVLLARAKGRGVLAARLRMGLWLAQRILPLRETGKACMFMGTDAGRAAARRVGCLLAERGALAQAEDVFYLERDEIMAAGTLTADIRTAVASRRALRAAYSRIELPDFFTSDDLREIAARGAPEAPASSAPPTLAQRTLEDFTINASAASAGRVTGVARIVRDPSRPGAFARGDILVCQVTDPGWSALFSIAGALVADVGGMLSHSAIIARELGIPAVVNTRDGSRRIPDGATVTVDGAAGVVVVHGERIGALRTA